MQPTSDHPPIYQSFSSFLLDPILALCFFLNFWSEIFSLIKIEAWRETNSQTLRASFPIPMEDYNRSGPYGNGHTMQMESYYGAPAPYAMRSYSTSYAQTQMGPNPKDLKLKKGKSISGSSIPKSWSFNDPELQRKKRVASYKMYSVEGKVKGSLRKSFRWLKDRYSKVIYGWWWSGGFYFLLFRLYLKFCLQVWIVGLWIMNMIS